MIEVIEHDKKINIMKKKVYEAIDLKNKFWTLFQNNEINLNEILELSTEYFSLKKEILIFCELIFDSLEQNYDHDFKHFYYNFMKHLFNIKVNKDLLSSFKHNNFDINLDEDYLFKNRFKSDTGIVIISTNPIKDFHKIQFINFAALEILGYENEQYLIGKDVDCLMPSVMQNIHSQLVKNFIVVGESNIHRKTIEFFMVNKKGYLEPISLLISFLPSFTNEVQGICIFQRRVKKEDHIISNLNGEIKNYTYELTNLLDNFELSNNQQYIQILFPKILEIDKNSEYLYPFFFHPEFETSFNFTLKMKTAIIVKNSLKVSDSINLINYKNSSITLEHSSNITINKNLIDNVLIDNNNLSSFNFEKLLLKSFYIRMKNTFSDNIQLLLKINPNFKKQCEQINNMYDAAIINIGKLNSEINLKFIEIYYRLYKIYNPRFKIDVTIRIISFNSLTTHFDNENISNANDEKNDSFNNKKHAINLIEEENSYIDKNMYDIASVGSTASTLSTSDLSNIRNDRNITFSSIYTNKIYIIIFLLNVLSICVFLIISSIYVDENSSYQTIILTVKNLLKYFTFLNNANIFKRIYIHPNSENIFGVDLKRLNLNSENLVDKIPKSYFYFNYDEKIDFYMSKIERYMIFNNVGKYSFLSDNSYFKIMTSKIKQMSSKFELLINRLLETKLSNLKRNEYYFIMDFFLNLDIQLENWNITFFNKYFKIMYIIGIINIVILFLLVIRIYNYLKKKNVKTKDYLNVFIDMPNLEINRLRENLMILKRYYYPKVRLENSSIFNSNIIEEEQELNNEVIDFENGNEYKHLIINIKKDIKANELLENQKQEKNEKNDKNDKNVKTEDNNLKNSINKYENSSNNDKNTNGNVNNDDLKNKDKNDASYLSNQNNKKGVNTVQTIDSDDTTLLSSDSKKFINTHKITLDFILYLLLMNIIYILLICYIIIYFYLVQLKVLNSENILNKLNKISFICSDLNLKVNEFNFLRMNLVRDFKSEYEVNNISDYLKYYVEILNKDLLENDYFEKSLLENIMNFELCSRFNLKYCKNRNFEIKTLNDSVYLDSSFKLEFMISNSTMYNYTYYDYANRIFFILNDQNLSELNSDSIIKDENSTKKYVGEYVYHYQKTGLNGLINGLIEYNYIKYSMNLGNFKLYYNSDCFYDTIKEEIVGEINSLIEIISEKYIKIIAENISFYRKLNIIIVICWLLIYHIAETKLLNNALSYITKQETVSKKLIGEIPDVIIRKNKEIYFKINNLLL